MNGKTTDDEPPAPLGHPPSWQPWQPEGADSEEEEEKPALRVRDLAEGTVQQGRSQRIPPAAPAPAKKRKDRRSQASKDFSKALDLVKAKAVRARATLAQAAARPAADPDEVEAI